MNLFNKPVIVLGHGVRASGADPSKLLDLRCPILTSWQGADLVDNFHPMYFGRPGIYGQRVANRVLYEAEEILAIGTRLCPWTIGHGGLRAEQKLTMVDIDGMEAAKFPQADWINMDAKQFIDTVPINASCYSWLKQCENWKEEHGWTEFPAHSDTPGFINSYRFVKHLEPLLPSDALIVTDNGSVMCPVFQGLHLRPPQRLMTAGALGEMGCGLPGAIGASFARGKGEVFNFIGDGGMMMNIQELATIVHHNLPIKMMVFENDGYSMIKGTYDNVKKPRRGVSKESGLSFPDFNKVAESYDIENWKIRTWDDFDNVIPWMLACKEPCLVQVHIDPEQQFVPRLKPIIKDGVITPAKFSELSPIL